MRAVLWLQNRTMTAAHKAATTGGVVLSVKERQRADPVDPDVRTEIQLDRITERTRPKMAPMIPQTSAMSNTFFQKPGTSAFLQAW